MASPQDHPSTAYGHENGQTRDRSHRWQLTNFSLGRQLEPPRECSGSNPAASLRHLFLKDLSTLLRRHETPAFTNEQHSRGGSGAAAGLLLSGQNRPRRGLSRRAVGSAQLAESRAQIKGAEPAALPMQGPLGRLGAGAPGACAGTMGESPLRSPTGSSPDRESGRAARWGSSALLASKGSPNGSPTRVATGGEAIRSPDCSDAP
jgi:hypothetical protein